MRVITFEKGWPLRRLIRWMILEDNPRHKTEIRIGRPGHTYYRKTVVDLTYPYEPDFDWLQAAHDLAWAYGLILYQDKLGTWRLRVLTWKYMKEKILKERGLP